METLLNKKHKFSIILRDNDSNSCIYRVNRKIYDTLKKYLEPFRSYQAQPRKIKCVETEEIFNSAKETCLLVRGKTKNELLQYGFNKTSLPGKETSYGYHWEFVEDSNEI
ncbi:hypothetical protein [Campylobacter cuniculorum]|uniref:hypothetical protein n=1 Tax=Campylobacter cuniculorum TaxID=374106 RepID=UPI0023F2B3C0|nr:hypothetical protein [Campylobacter cuniculorum]